MFVLAHYGIYYFAELRSLDEEFVKTRTGKILKTLAEEAFEIQKLMKRVNSIVHGCRVMDALLDGVFLVLLECGSEATRFVGCLSSH